MGFLSSIFGGGSSSVSTSTSETNVEVTVQNAIDTGELGEAVGTALLDIAAIEKQEGEKTRQQQLEIAQAELELESVSLLQKLQQSEQLTKFLRAGIVLGGAYLIFKVMKK